MALRLDPSDFGPLFGGGFGHLFLLATSPDVREMLEVDCPAGQVFEEFSWSGTAPRARLLERLARTRADGQRGSVLWITTDEFEHFPPERLCGSSVAAISFFSAPLEEEVLDRYLQIARLTDYQGQVDQEERFLSMLDGAERVRFVSPHGTEAIFDHHRADHWFSINGPIGPDQQCVLPTGEISALVAPSGVYSEADRFALDGEILLRGAPIVHRGGPEVAQAGVDDAFARLAAMADHPVIARLERGEIVGLRTPRAGPNPLLDALNDLFAADERYRKIHEIGFGMNRSCSALMPGNFFPNERYPGVHFGIGLGGHTDLHIDLVCVDLAVLLEFPGGHTLDAFGGPPR